MVRLSIMVGLLVAAEKKSKANPGGQPGRRIYAETLAAFASPRSARCRLFRQGRAL